jgi:hypothetical protein
MNKIKLQTLYLKKSNSDICLADAFLNAVIRLISSSDNWRSTVLDMVF